MVVSFSAQIISWLFGKNDWSDAAASVLVRIRRQLIMPLIVGHCLVSFMTLQIYLEAVKARTLSPCCKVFHINVSFSLFLRRKIENALGFLKHSYGFEGSSCFATFFKLTIISLLYNCKSLIVGLLLVFCVHKLNLAVLFTKFVEVELNLVQLTKHAWDFRVCYVDVDVGLALFYH